MFAIIRILPLESRGQNNDDENGLLGPIIGGATAGVLVLIFILALLCTAVWFRKHSSKKKKGMCANHYNYTCT